jgi:hypothetical protein
MLASMRRFAFVLVAALACARATQDRPDAAYVAFARAVAERDADRAFALLSSDTQAWLDARAKAVAAAAPGVVPPSGRALLLGDASLAPPPLGEAVVVREAKDRALVAVAEDGGARREVELVREGGWRVRIPPP